MCVIRVVRGLIFSFFFMWSGAGYAQDQNAGGEVLVMGTIASTPDSYSRAVEHLYHRLGLEVDIQTMPIRRLINRACDGKLDGLIAISWRARACEGLVMSQTPFSILELKPYALDQNIQINDIWDLDRYRVAASMRLQNSTLKGDIRYVSSSEGTALLLANRVDIYIDHVYALLEHSQTIKPSPEFHEVGSSILEATLFHAIGKKHSALLPKVELILDEMTKEGILPLS